MVIPAEPSAVEGSSERLHASRIVAAKIASRVRLRDAQVRNLFVEGPPGAAQDPPLATMIRGGRGGEVRLKLFLSVLWIAVGDPHDVSLPSQTWATLLGLPDPSGAGARRVTAAIKWLAAHQFLEVEAEPGKPHRLFLLNETGTGNKYRLPGAEISRLRAADEDWEADRYVKVPSALWTNGWLCALSGSATAMFLVLLARGATGENEVWFSPGFADERYRLSEDTRHRGLTDLQILGLVAVKKRPLTRSPLDVVRLRNTYTLRTAALQRHADVVLPPRTMRRGSTLSKPESGG